MPWDNIKPVKNIFILTKKLRTFKKVINHIVMHYVNLGLPEINMVVILEKVLQMLWTAIHIKKIIVLKNVRMLIIHVMLLNPLNLLLNQLLKPLNLHLNQLSNPLSLHLNQLLNPLNLHQNPMKLCLILKMMVTNNVNLLPKMNLSLLIVWISKLKLSTLLIGD